MTADRVITPAGYRDSPELRALADQVMAAFDLRANDVLEIRFTGERVAVVVIDRTDGVARDTLPTRLLLYPWTS